MSDTERAKKERANYLLRNCQYVLKMCWIDLNEWVRFGRYNSEGILCGDTLPIPDPPQRPTIAGVNKTDQNVAVVEEVLAWIHRHLEETIDVTDEIPPRLSGAINKWLQANDKTPEDVRWGLFPLGMVQRWIERAEEAEAKAKGEGR